MKLIAYSSSMRGGMMGGYSSIQISYTEDGRCRVVTAEKAMHNEPTTHTTYYVEGLMEKLNELCERYEVITWTDLPESNVFMCDDAPVSRRFTFEGGIIIELGSRKQTPAGAREMLSELTDILVEARNNGRDFEVTSEDANTMGFRGTMTLGMMNGHPQSTDSAPVVNRPGMDSSEWAKFCENCGSRFEGEIIFCRECGSPRKKLRK